MANEFAPTEASNAGRDLQPRPNRLDESMRCNINKGWVLPMPETLYLLTLAKSSPAYNWGVSAVGANSFAQFIRLLIRGE